MRRVGFNGHLSIMHFKDKKLQFNHHPVNNIFGYDEWMEKI